MHLQNRTFIISGGASGLGLATTTLLLSHGAYVSILDLNAPPEQSLSDEQRSRAQFYKTDVSSSESLENAVSNTVKWSKETGKPLGGVVTCAGVGMASLALPKQTQDQEGGEEKVKYYDMRHFDKVIGINLRGTVDLIRLVIPYLAVNEGVGDDNERGVVIVVSSVAAYEGQVGQLAYSASKGAVASIVLPLARELGQKAGIRVMGVAPGMFETGMTKMPPKRRKQAKTGAEVSKERSEKPVRQPNPEMVQYPMRMGQGQEFARLVREIIENPMLNGNVIRLDGAVRMPSRL